MGRPPIYICIDIYILHEASELEPEPDTNRPGTGTGQEPAEPEPAEPEPAKNRSGQDPEQAQALYTLYTL